MPGSADGKKLVNWILDGRIWNSWPGMGEFSVASRRMIERYLKVDFSESVHAKEKKMHDVSCCIGCGCDGGCSWIRLDRKAGLGVCSECEHRASDWDNGKRCLSQEAEINLLR